jgi:hypothetical protein
MVRAQASKHCTFSLPSGQSFATPSQLSVQILEIESPSERFEVHAQGFSTVLTTADYGNTSKTLALLTCKEPTPGRKDFVPSTLCPLVKRSELHAPVMSARIIGLLALAASSAALPTAGPWIVRASAAPAVPASAAPLSRKKEVTAIGDVTARDFVILLPVTSRVLTVLCACWILRL